MARPGSTNSVKRVFWRAVAAGSSTETAADLAGVSLTPAFRWFRDAGGMPPLSLKEPSDRFLTFEERERIALLRAAGEGLRVIARQLGRSAGTISRELKRNSCSEGPIRYRASAAQRKAECRAARPKPSKLASDDRLRERVTGMLERKLSPEQISARLAVEYPNDASMRISHETIYRALYVQGKGALRRELAACLRTGRALRKPRHRVDARSKRTIKDMVMISQRPAEIEDRAVPGHWEGDLITGKSNKSAIGTLVERATRYVMLLHLPERHDAASVAAAMINQIGTLPEQIRGTITWDQGVEMANHAAITLATDMEIYFCDPHSPWQRGTNENTNGLLRQYFPKGTDLSTHNADHLAFVAAELNDRPRKTLDWKTPKEALAQFLDNLDQQRSVATTS